VQCADAPLNHCLQACIPVVGHQESTGSQPSHRTMKILLIVLCFFIPPLAVYLKTSNVKTTLINLVLSFFFFVPGVIHALWVVLNG
jgi:uncharacterized membrane protein YqaE (UPF0057 family)